MLNRNILQNISVKIELEKVEVNWFLGIDKINKPATTRAGYKNSVVINY